DHRHDLALPGCQRIEAPFQIGQFVRVLAPRVVPIEGDPYGVQEILVAKRLREEFDRSRLHRADAHRDVAVAGQKYDRNEDVSGGELALEVESAQSGQPDVQHETTGNLRKSLAEKTVSRFKGFDAQTDGAQEKRQ